MDKRITVHLHKKFFPLLMVVISTLVASCSYIPSFRFPAVYKINVQQGNVVNQEVADKLQLGMTKKQVRYVMGTPLVVDTFNQERWDYFYSLKTGKGDYAQKKLVLLFKNDKLDSVTGDVVPAHLGSKPPEIQVSKSKEENKNPKGSPMSSW